MIARYRSEFPVSVMCRMLGVSRAGFYAAEQRTVSARRRQDTKLAVAIAISHQRSRQTYGSTRVLADLRAEGHRVGRKRVARLMKAVGLVGKPRRRFRVTTQSQHDNPLAANVLGRNFSAVKEANRVWVADITYLWTLEGWLFLAVVLDVASRRVVGWSLGTRLGTELVRRALEQALATRQTGLGLIHHSDRGVQYASKDYRALLASRGIVCSMSRRGDCWDNAMAESFFATFKRELVESEQWETRSAAASSVFRYLECWYNTQRRHSSLGYLSPAAFEAQLARVA